MGLRFRKSFKLLPGVRINYGLRSTSMSFGGKGFHTTVSSTGRVTRSVGVPGTGFSYVTSSFPNRNDRQGTQKKQSISTLVRSLYSEKLPNLFANRNVQQPLEESIREHIKEIYRYADTPIDWKKILITESDPGTPYWQYFKEKAEKVLNGDIDTYFSIFSDINPLNDLLAYGSEFEFGTDDPRMLVVGFTVNSLDVLGEVGSMESSVYYDLLQDYVCGCSIRVARDMFALLPLRRILVNASDREGCVVSVDFSRDRFLELDFTGLDASDTVEQFRHSMEFDPLTGFSVVSALE